MSHHNILNPIHTIITDELPDCYIADTELTFGNLSEQQEETFKLTIKLEWSGPGQKAVWGEWHHRMLRRIHERYGRSLLLALHFPQGAE